MDTRPCFLWGAARSGTNVVTRNLALSPDVECFNEDDARAFDNFFLFDTPIISALLHACERPVAFFKAFNDSPRADEVMRDFPDARAIYALREPRATIDSFVASWPGWGRVLWANRLAEASRGGRGALSRLGASDARVHENIRRHARHAAGLLDAHEPTDHNVAAVYYLWQHAFFAELSPDAARRTLVVDYTSLTADPAPQMRRVTDWFGVEPGPAGAEPWHRGGKTPRREGAPDTDLLAACERLYRSILTHAPAKPDG